MDSKDDPGGMLGISSFFLLRERKSWGKFYPSFQRLFFLEDKQLVNNSTHAKCESILARDMYSLICNVKGNCKNKNKNFLQLLRLTNPMVCDGIMPPYRVVNI